VELAAPLLALLRGALDELTGVDDAAPPQTLPVTVGRSTDPPLVSPWRPKVTDWPGAMLPFHAMLVAVTGVVPAKFAFQPLDMRLLLYCQLTLQSLMVALVSLVMVMLATKPEPHSLSME